MEHKYLHAIKQLHWIRVMGIEYYYAQNRSIAADRQQLKVYNKNQLQRHSVRFRHNEFKNKPAEPILIGEHRQSLQNSFVSTLPNDAVHAAAVDNGNPVLSARVLADNAQDLTELRLYVENFNGCALKSFATNTVFADGNPAANIMFIGEAPGASEDKAGIPFCGESGQLLDNMLQAIGISRKLNAYITNTIFWRPPANRAPTLEELDVCRPFVEKHIALINPKLIVLVGNTAATSLLGKHAGITNIRQEYYLYTNKYLQQPISTTAIFHPAYLLRQPMQKKATWYDLLKIQQFCDYRYISEL